MSEENENIENTAETKAAQQAHLENRRRFLKIGGLGIAALALAQTTATATFANPSAKQTTTTIDLGSGDTGILNFAYLLEQLEADFYTRVVNNNFYTGATAEERQILTDLRDHEIIHREFYTNLLGSAAIPRIPAFNFSLVDFNSRDSVLTNSQVMEDTGVAAYNGAGQLLVSATNLTLAGKIVSVEGRHAAAIRDLRIPRLGFFADSGADFALDPLTVLTLAAPFLPTNIRVTATNLPRLIFV